ncbi:MAG: ABC transporter permease, partial [Ruminococcus sp.]|nr:ABC transporter permease [Ruminococcus sp.]
MDNIVFKVTKKYMKLNRRRTAIAFMGITLMVVMMTCVFVGKETVMKYLDKVASLDKGSWHIIAYGLDTDTAKTVASRDYTEKAALSEQLYCLDFPQTAEPDVTPYLSVKAFSEGSFEMNNITVTEGRLPENSNELIISEYAAGSGADIKVGDRISGEFFKRIMVSKLEKGVTEFPFSGLQLPAGKSIEIPANFGYFGENDSFYEKKELTGLTGDYTVVGIMKSPAYEKRGEGSYAALTCFDEPRTDLINIMLRLDTDKISGTGEVAADIEALTGKEPELEFNEMLLTFSAMSGDSNINTIVIFMEAFFTLFTMAASVILIYNVFNMSFAERTKYLGMLSSVGATRRQKRQSIYYESFALLLPALPAGIIIGMGVVYAGTGMLKPHFDSMLSIVNTKFSSDVPLKLSFGISEIVIVIVMCVVTVLISALIPAVK